MSKKKDKTRANIKNAYITLLKGNGPLNITVSDICRVCKINRSTFYEYYSYIDLLVEDVIYDQIDLISKENNALYDEYYLKNITSPEKVTQYIQNLISSEVLMRFIKSSDANGFKAAISIAQTKYEINRYNIVDLDKKIQTTYRNSGILAIVFQWIEKKIPCTIEELSSHLANEIIKTGH